MRRLGEGMFGRGAGAGALAGVARLLLLDGGGLQLVQLRNLERGGFQLR